MSALDVQPELPPGLAALAGGPPPGAPPSITVPGGPPPAPAGPQGGGNEIDLLNDIRQMMLAYLDHPEADDIDKKEMTVAIKAIQGILAKNQQNAEAAQGGTTSPAALAGMRQALRG